MLGFLVAPVATHASSAAQPPTRLSLERPKPRQVTMVVEGLEVVVHLLAASPVTDAALVDLPGSEDRLPARSWSVARLARHGTNIVGTVLLREGLEVEYV